MIFLGILLRGVKKDIEKILLMNVEYLNYSLEELLEDKVFISWVLNGNKNDEWNTFIKNNPEINHRVQKARSIILLLRDKYEVLDEDSVLLLWQKIDGFDKLYQEKVRRIKTRRTLSWAASILMIIALGTIGYYINYQKSAYEFSATEISKDINEARLVLSDGESIDLQNDNSTVSLSNDNKLIINNDSIIDLSGEKQEDNITVKMNEVIIPYGKKSELLLADGTKVWINAGSRLAFPSQFTKKNREVYLEGEACFDVAKNEEQPFIVKAGEVDIKVLGTHFDVSAYKDDANIDAILLEGSITLSNLKSFGFGKKEVLLKPNQRASYNKQENEINVSNEPNANEYIAWTEGWFEFSRESLNSVFRKLERYYNVKIITPEKFPSTELITGKLDLKDSLDKVMVALGDVAKIEFRISENSIYIEKKMN